MIASFPMYLAPGEAVQSLWNTVAAMLTRRIGPSVPRLLCWPQDLPAHWLAPELLLSQTCGYPLSTALRHQVQVVGTFAYDAPGCNGIFCKSQLIRRSTDARATLAEFAGSTLAFNGSDSQSGFNALRALIAATQPQQPFFGATVETGGHNASIEKVRTGLADMAAIDCVTLALWRDANPALATDITTFGETAPYPGLPLITSLATPAATVSILRDCLAAIATDARYADVRAALRIRDFAVTALEDYAVCLQMEAAGLRSDPMPAPRQTPN